VHGLVSADERQTAGSKSSISAESSRMSSDKGKSSSDERAFAVISTPKSSLQPVSDQFTVAAVQVVDKRQIDRGDQSKPSVKLEPKVVRVTQEDSSVAAGQAMTRGPEGKLPVQTDRQKQQREVKVDQKPIESSKPELASRKPVPVSRTDPAHLHKLVSQRIEQTLSSKQEEFSTTNTTHEVRTQYSKSPVSVESTTASATVQKDQSGTQRARLGSDPAENVSTEQRKEREAAEKTRTDVRQVRVMKRNLTISEDFTQNLIFFYRLSQNKLTNARLIQYLIHTFATPLVGPVGQSPPKCYTQCRAQTSFLVRKFSQIHSISTVWKEMHPGASLVRSAFVSILIFGNDP